MSNTYETISKNVTRKTHKTVYEEQMHLSLTAFAGGDEVIQITVQTVSDIEGHSGTAFVTLTKAEIRRLIRGLKKRLNGEVPRVP